MKVLGIVGSRRRRGNTAALVGSAMQAVKNEGIAAQTIYLDDYDIGGCRGCEACSQTRRCVVQDGMQPLYPLIMEADAIVMGSPTHFYNVSAAVCSFFERCYCLETFDATDRSVWVSQGEALGGKYAVVIAVCEQADEADMGFTADAMRLPLESLGYRVVDTVKALKLFEKDAALQSQESLTRAAAAGQKLARTLLLRQNAQSLLKQFAKL